MNKRAFSASERYAVFTVHGEHCYICREPVNMTGMHVDHVIPEALVSQPGRLRDVLQLLGRSATFDINGFENWMPACPRCNLLKADRVWDPSLLVQLALQIAAERAPEAKQVMLRIVNDRQESRALNGLMRAAQGTHQEQQVVSLVDQIRSLLKASRQPSEADKPLRVSPLYEVLSEAHGIRLIKGPYGVGGQPTMASPDRSFWCPHCGQLGAWSGARCVICGQMDDD